MTVFKTSDLASVSIDQSAKVKPLPPTPVKLTKRKRGKRR